MPLDPDREREMNEYLARIRKTIADSQAIVSQAELRIAETDRLLEQQGITREQLLAMRFSEEQRQLVNAELERRGLQPLSDEDFGDGPDTGTLASDYAPLAGGTPTDGDELERRRQKFGMMMKPFQI